MKKFISAVLAAALTFSALGAFAAPQQNASDDTQTSASTTPIVSAYGKTDDSTVLLGTGVSAQDTPSTVSESASAAVTITSGGTTLYSGDLPTTDDGDTGMLRFGLSKAVVAKSVSVDGTQLSAEDWFTGADSKALYISSAKLSGSNISIEITADTTAASVYTLGINTFADAEFTENGATYRGSAISVFGKAVGNVDEFGVLFGRTKAEVEEYSSDYTQSGNAYPALAKNSNGEFVVQLIDASSLPTAVYACAYYKSGSSYTYGAVKQVSSLPQIESFKLSTADTNESFVGTIDQSAKTITIDVPYMKNTFAKITSLNIEAKLNSSADEVKIGDTALTESGNTYTGTLTTFTDAMVYITSDQNMTAYKLVINRDITLTFDNELITGVEKENTVNEEYKPCEKTDTSAFICAKENTAIATFFYVNVTKNTTNDSDGNYLKQKSISVEALSSQSDEIKNLNNSTASKASGNILKINNPSNSSEKNARKDCGGVALKIGTRSQFDSAGISSATTVSFEYDVAYGAENCYGGVNPFMNGAYIYGGTNTNYNIDGTALVRLQGANADQYIDEADKSTSSLSRNGKLQYQAGKNALNNGTAAETTDMSMWRHVKAEFTRPSADSTYISINIYYDGVLEKEYKPGEGDLDGFTMSWPSKLVLKNATNRACQTYFDNVKISWNTAVTAADDISAFDVAGATTEIDRTNNVINVAFPIYSVVDGSTLILGSAKAYASSLNGGEVKLNDTAITADGTDINWSDVLSTANITVGDKEYTLKVQRQLFDDFDGNTYISGRAQGTLDSSGNLTCSEGINNKLSSVYSLNVNGSYNSENAYKSTLAQNLYWGVYPVSDAKAVGGTASMQSADSAKPNGNGFKVLKAFAVTSKNSYANKFIVNAGEMDGMSNATTMSMDFDMAYDCNECKSSVKIGENDVNGTIGSTVGGLELGSDKYRITGNSASMSGDARANGKVQVFDENGMTTATLDKWNHIKIDVSRTAADATSATLDVYVNGVKIVEGGEYTWANLANLKFQTSTFRAGAWWIDNLDIRYNVN